MSSVHGEAHAETHQAAVEHRPHPNYVGVFVVLFVLTAIEVGVSFVPQLPQAPILISLMILKAGAVALYYMHLKFDSRVFSWLFGTGLVTATFLLISFLVLFAHHVGIAG